MEACLRMWCIGALVLIGAPASSTFTVDIETELRHELLANYSTAVRPSQVTLVELSFTLLSINYVDLRNEQFSVSGWWSMEWEDKRLSWTGTAYNVPVIQVYDDDVWTPALVVDNSVNDLSAIDEDTIPLRVAKDGRVTWNPPGILSTSCEMIVTFFPFDDQTCALEVTSFGYTIQELNISVRSSGVNTRYFNPNGEWTLLQTWNERSDFSEDGYSYARVTYYFKLQRRAVFYGLNTMLPVLLNSLLIPLVFMLPHDSGEKIGYCLTTLLAYVVILTLVTDGLPSTAKTQSLLGVYIAMILMLSGLSVALAIHSLYIYHQPPEKPIAPWQAKLTRLARCFMLKDRTCRRDRVQEMPSSAKARQDKAVSASNIGADVNSTTSGDDLEMTWQLMAQTYDSFFLRLYFFVIFFSSVAFLFGICSNQM